MVLALALLTLVVVVLGLFSLGSWASKPAVHRVAAGGLGEFVTNLYRRGYAGGVAVVRDRNKRRFVRLNKYILANGHLGLNLYLPTSMWTTEENQRLKDLVSKRDLQFGSEHF